MNRKIALVIGNSQYEDSTLSQLTMPEEDAEDFAAALKDPRIGGFDNISILINKSFAEVHLAIADFFSEKRVNDLLVFYFSGHGVLDDYGRLYLAVRDTQRNLLSGSAISARFITEEMDTCRSKRQILILDCCHSGAFSRGIKSTSESKAVTKATFEGSGYGKVVLTATDATQYAWEGDQVIGNAENSLFTHFLIKGLRTGLADIDGDGIINLDELYNYAYEQILNTTTKQRPRKWVYAQEGERLLIALSPLGNRTKSTKSQEELNRRKELLDDLKNPSSAFVDEIVKLKEYTSNHYDYSIQGAAIQGLEKIGGPDSVLVVTERVLDTGGMQGIRRAIKGLAKLVNDGGLLALVATLLWDSRFYSEKLFELSKVANKMKDQDLIELFKQIENNTKTGRELRDSIPGTLFLLEQSKDNDIRNGAVVAKTIEAPLPPWVGKVTPSDKRILDQSIAYTTQRIPGLLELLRNDKSTLRPWPY